MLSVSLSSDSSGEEVDNNSDMPSLLSEAPEEHTSALPSNNAAIPPWRRPPWRRIQTLTPQRHNNAAGATGKADGKGNTGKGSIGTDAGGGRRPVVLVPRAETSLPTVTANRKQKETAKQRNERRNL